MTVAGLLPVAAYDNIESLAAAAYAQGQSCVPILKTYIVPALPTRQRFTPERIVQHIKRQALLDERTATEIDVLVDMVSRLIAIGTIETVRWSSEYEGQATEPRSWIERHLTPDASRLALVMPEIETLLTLVRGVLDLVAAQGSVQRLIENRR